MKEIKIGELLTLTMRHPTVRIPSGESLISMPSRIGVRCSIWMSFFLRHPRKKSHT